MSSKWNQPQIYRTEILRGIYWIHSSWYWFHWIKKKACCCGVLKILITFKLCSWRNIIKSSFQATVNHVADLLGNIQASWKLNVMFLSCEWRIPILFVCVCLWCLLWQWLTEAQNWIFSLVLSLKVCMLLKGIVIGNCWNQN